MPAAYWPHPAPSGRRGALAPLAWVVALLLLLAAALAALPAPGSTRRAGRRGSRAASGDQRLPRRAGNGAPRRRRATDRRRGGDGSLPRRARGGGRGGRGHQPARGRRRPDRRQPPGLRAAARRADDPGARPDAPALLVGRQPRVRQGRGRAAPPAVRRLRAGQEQRPVCLDDRSGGARPGHGLLSRGGLPVPRRQRASTPPAASHCSRPTRSSGWTVCRSGSSAWC